MTMTDDLQQGHPLGVPATAGEQGSAREAVNEMLDAGLLDGVMDRVDAGGLALTGQGGFLPEMVKAGTHTLTAADPLPDDLRLTLEALHCRSSAH